ncbi:MAG TPA: hypothetical protein VGD43_22885, partial [Micromonospora sp.]
VAIEPVPVPDREERMVGHPGGLPDGSRPVPTADQRPTADQHAAGAGADERNGQARPETSTRRDSELGRRT